MLLDHTPVSHAMVGSEYISGFPVCVKYVFKHVSYSLDSLVNQLYVLQILSVYRK